MISIMIHQREQDEHISGRKQTNEQDYQSVEMEPGEEKKTAIINTFPYQSLKPLLLLMQAFGHYHNRHIGPRGRFWQAYSAGTCVLVLGSLIRALIDLKGKDLSFNTELFRELVVVAWLVLCIGNSFTMFLVWANYKKGPEFLLMMDSLVDSSISQIKHHCFRVKLRRRTWVLVGLTSIIIVWNSTVGAFSLFLAKSDSNQTSFACIIAPKIIYDQLPEWGKYFATSVGIFIFVYNTAQWCLPIAFNHCVCFALRMELESFNRVFEEELHTDSCLKEITKYRKRHQQVAKLIEKANDLLSLHISTTISSTLVLLIFLFYNVILDKMIERDTPDLIAEYGWVAIGVVSLGIVCHGGASINQAAHESLHRLHDVVISEDQTNKENAELILFINKLSGPQIGLTALGLFVINKQAILTFIGIFLTYFIIVVQFRLT